MKTFSVSQEALWGLKSFLGVVPVNDITGLYPELLVKALIRMDHIGETVEKAFEETEMQKALKEVEEKINAFRAELIAPFGGEPIPPAEDAVLGAKIRERFEEIQKELITPEIKSLKVDVELSDDKAEMLTNVFNKLGGKYLLSKQMIVLIGKELGLEE